MKPIEDIENKLVFSVDPNKYILQPLNSISTKAQQKTFELLENLQKDLIYNYENLSEDRRMFLSNQLANMFIEIFFLNDSSLFKFILGFDSKGSLTKTELENLKRDFDIAKRYKHNNEFKSFFLLDMIFLSNRRADAIIITNDYEIELFDFSEGTVVEKLKKLRDNPELLSKTEKEQLIRKTKQQDRINSYKGKIKPNIDKLEVIIDGDSKTIKLLDINIKYFDIVSPYQAFIKTNSKVYIPNSICFFLSKDEINSDYICFKLKNNIDSPIFHGDNKLHIPFNILEHIYKNDTYIGISRIYLNLFFSLFTTLELFIINRHDKDQLTIKENNRERGIWIKDTRTNEKIPLTYGILSKHVFMNVDLESWITYISALCNTNKDIDFNKKAFLSEKIINTPFTFFCTKLINTKFDIESINEEELKNIKWIV